MSAPMRVRPAPGMGWAMAGAALPGPQPLVAGPPGPRPLAPLVTGLAGPRPLPPMVAGSNIDKVKPVGGSLVAVLFSPHSPLFRPPWIYVTFAFFVWLAVAFDLLYAWLGNVNSSGGGGGSGDAFAPYSPPHMHQNTELPR